MNRLQSVAVDPSTGGDNDIDISALPVEIPLGVLLPRRVENLLPAASGRGEHRRVGGAARGLLPPARRPVRAGADRVADFQRLLQGDGVEIRWPRPMQSPQ